MISNIVDNRKNQYNVTVDAVFEPSSHDNSITGATQFREAPNQITYEELTETTVAAAIRYGEQWPYAVTLFLYDPGSLILNFEDLLEQSGC